MTAAPEQVSPQPTGPLELKPYSRPTDKRLRRLLIGAVVTFCFLYGFVFAFLAPYLLVPMIIPVVVLGALVLWALPETAKAAPVDLLEFLFFAFFVAMVMWPNYLAVAIPGLPWITVQRLIAAPLTLVLLTCVSVSVPFRSQLSAVLRTTPLVGKLICLFVLLQAVSITFSGDKVASANLFANVLTNWVALFFAGSFVLTRHGRAERFAGLLCLMAVALGGIALWEHELNHLPWVGHIPGFLQVNDPNVQRFLAGTARLGKSQYRVQATFSTSLGLSEYLALAMPFLLHFAATQYRPVVRIAAICAVPVVLGTAVLSQARVGLVGILLTLLLYPIARAFLHWRRNPASLAAASIVFLSPLLVVAGLGLALVIPGIRYRVLGGGGEQYSNQGRWDQVHMGLPMVMSQPWGHGIGRGAETLGYVTSYGGFSIDSYPLRLALEYGFVGLVIYYGLFAAALIYAARAALSSPHDSREAKLFIPIGIALLSFTVMQIVFAQEDNQPIVFALLGMLMALRLHLFGTHRMAEAAALTT